MLCIQVKLSAAQPQLLVYEDFDRWRVTATEPLPMWMPTQALDDPGSIPRANNLESTVHGDYWVNSSLTGQAEGHADMHNVFVGALFW